MRLKITLDWRYKDHVRATSKSYVQLTIGSYVKKTGTFNWRLEVTSGLRSKDTLELHQIVMLD